MQSSDICLLYVVLRMQTCCSGVCRTYSRCYSRNREPVFAGHFLLNKWQPKYKTQCFGPFRRRRTRKTTVVNLTGNTLKLTRSLFSRTIITRQSRSSVVLQAVWLAPSRGGHLSTGHGCDCNDTRAICNLSGLQSRPTNSNIVLGWYAIA